MSIDKLGTKNQKDRQDLAHLNNTLDKIDKQKKNELRLHNNEQQRFRAKYLKDQKDDPFDLTNIYTNHTSSLSLPSTEEKTRVLEFEVSMRQSTVGALQFRLKELQPLLFTNGEVDIEKVLCLHLLSMHKTESLSPPVANGSHYVPKKHSPLEQLVERSKRRYKILVSMPPYVLDVDEKVSSTSVQDGRLNARILVNEKVSILIRTVVGALNKTNPQKMQELLKKSRDMKYLAAMFEQPYIRDFLEMLKQNSLLYSCDCFRLTAPYKVAPVVLEVTSSAVLNSLLHLIHSSVLQLPVGQSPKKEGGGPSRAAEAQESEVELPAAAPPLPPPKKSKRPTRPSVSGSAASTSAQANVARETLCCPSTEAPCPPTCGIMKAIDNSNLKVHLKQTTCLACMEKWKTPLPSPKMQSLRRTRTHHELKTNSLHRLSHMIEEEMFHLESYDRKFSNTSRTSRSSQSSDNQKKNWSDDVELSVYQLEKIKQEIREKETNRKLDKFMASD